MWTECHRTLNGWTLGVGRLSLGGEMTSSQQLQCAVRPWDKANVKGLCNYWLMCDCATVPLEDPGSQLTAHGKGCSAVVRVQQPSMPAWY
jgi:hypothetical protein